MYGDVFQNRDPNWVDSLLSVPGPPVDELDDTVFPSIDENEERTDIDPGAHSIAKLA